MSEQLDKIMEGLRNPDAGIRLAAARAIEGAMISYAITEAVAPRVIGTLRRTLRREEDRAVRESIVDALGFAIFLKINDFEGLTTVDASSVVRVLRQARDNDTDGGIRKIATAALSYYAERTGRDTRQLSLFGDVRQAILDLERKGRVPATVLAGAQRGPVRATA